MKRAALVVLLVFLLGNVSWAHMGEGMMQGYGQEEQGETEGAGEGYGGYYGYGPGMMGYGMGSGMMGYGMGSGMMGYGYGPGMMGYGMGSGMMGYGMGPGMMGCGMGPGMMGYGMGPGMMGYGMGPGMMYSRDPEVKKFLDETVDERRRLHAKMFDYMEAIRDPKSDRDKIKELRDEIGKMAAELRKKAPWGGGY